MLVLLLVITSAVLNMVNLVSTFSDSPLIYPSYLQLRVDDRDKCQKTFAGFIRNSESSKGRLVQTIW